jgi:serine/threonine protein kinase
LLDFGAANQFLEGVTGTLVGKQAYVPPEQLRGKATKQSDIYSFGATMYYLLTGFEPRALAQSDVLKAGEKISPELNELIKQCTEFDESKRPQSFDELRVRLQMIAGCTLSSEAKPYEISSSATERFESNMVTTFRVTPINAAVSAAPVSTTTVSTVSAGAPKSNTTASTVSATPPESAVAELQNAQNKLDKEEQKSETIKINIENGDLVKELTK